MTRPPPKAVRMAGKILLAEGVIGLAFLGWAALATLPFAGFVEDNPGRALLNASMLLIGMAVVPAVYLVLGVGLLTGHRAAGVTLAAVGCAAFAIPTAFFGGWGVGAWCVAPAVAPLVLLAAASPAREWLAGRWSPPTEVDWSRLGGW